MQFGLWFEEVLRVPVVSAPRAREREVGVSGPFCFQLLGKRQLDFPLPSTCVLLGAPLWP